MTAAESAAGDHASLLRFLESARWFAGKSRSATVRTITALPWLRAPGVWPAVRLEIVEVGYPDAQSEYYQLPLAYRPDDEPGSTPVVRTIDDPEHGTLSAGDATDDPAAGSVILGALLDRRRFDDDDDHELEFVLEPDAIEIPADLPARRFTGEQSNTSIRYGDLALLKLFRRLELGDNLDITLHRALNEAGADDAAQLYGRITAGWTAAGALLRADLGMLTEQFVDAEDGWWLAVTAAESGADFTEQARALGAALATVHRGLRSVFGTDERSGDDTADAMAERLSRIHAFAPQLDDHLDGIAARFEGLRGLSLQTQRVHGDFHLGQTLRTPTGWKIIDFEGEPAKSMAERLLPDSPWRDVAGMLRSFDYAVADSPEAAEQGWAAATQAAFLAGYAGEEPDRQDAMIIAAYEADKAVYELGYEIRNRPDWVGIPLAAITRLAAADQSDTEQQETGDNDHG